MALYRLVPYLFSFLGVIRSPDADDFNGRCGLKLNEGGASICYPMPFTDYIACTFICGFVDVSYSECSPDHGWSNKLPDCVADLKDKPKCGLNVRNGAAHCHDEEGGKISCVVLCDGKTNGFYNCLHDRGWDKQLPHCVSHFEEGSWCTLVVRNGIANCKARGGGGTTCDISCNGKFQGTYVCENHKGWDRSLPHCVSSWGAPEKILSRATECNSTGCSTNCGSLQLEGKCIDGVCKCH